MVMSREEVFRATGPTSGAVVEVKIGAKKDGHIVAAQTVLKYQAGAFPGSPVQQGCICAMAIYDFPNALTVGYDVLCNRPKVAAYRAPGAPIGSFAVESCVDELARALRIDPLRMREINGARDGTKATHGVTWSNIGYQTDAGSRPRASALKTPLGPNQGRGIASGYWHNAGGESSAACHVNEDGTITVTEGHPDIGGSRASMAMMVAEVLGVPYEQRPPGGRRHDGDRLQRLDRRQPRHLRRRHGGDASRREGHRGTQKARRDDLGHQPRRGRMEGRAAPSRPAPMPAASSRSTCAAIAAKSGRTGGPISAEVQINAQGQGPGFTTHICDVEVDRETGHVKILRYTAIQDVGRAIHPSYVEGQMQGGVTQGIGWALSEEYIYDKDGHLENPGFLDYRMPVASDLPMIDTIMVEVPNPRHPFGARGVGEVPLVPPMAAVANAIFDATGIRLRDLPMSPPKLRAAFDAEQPRRQAAE